MNELIFLLMAVGFVLLSFFLLSKPGLTKIRKDTLKKDSLQSEDPGNELIDDATPFEPGMVDDFTPALAKNENTPAKKISEALKKTEENLWGRIRNIFTINQAPSELLEKIEEVLYTSDLGPRTVERLMTSLNQKLKKNELSDLETLKRELKSEMLQVFKDLKNQEHFELKDELNSLFAKRTEGPLVLLVVGVNGVGKTTTIGKLSAAFAKEGKKVLVAAGDTFRAAAEKQLKTWTDRAQVEIFSPEGTKDPSAVAFDAISKAKAKAYDVVIVDTAGRLHNQGHLMEELKKMKRVMTKVIPESPHYSWIVLDANNGQNALVQAREFHKAISLDGVILTKLDGTAKGGIAVSIVHELGLPIQFIGIGETINDLQVFNAEEFVSAIL
ncbi:MAG TPA: signal recognition particle-docking protein FtsY [Pseudobdellovibrionaceae bacterium]|nr:signal recognition particle-docking protein FtsY [Pseudobdellovibrionaceae bacterium]